MAVRQETWFLLQGEGHLSAHLPNTCFFRESVKQQLHIIREPSVALCNVTRLSPYNMGVRHLSRRVGSPSHRDCCATWAGGVPAGNRGWQQSLKGARILRAHDGESFRAAAERAQPSLGRLPDGGKQK